MSMKDLRILRKRLLYHSQHRGMQEMDLLLGNFAQKFIETMDEESLKQFEILLAFPDSDLFSLFFERHSLSQGIPQDMINRIKEFVDFSKIS